MNRAENGESSECEEVALLADPSSTSRFELLADPSFIPSEDLWTQSTEARIVHGIAELPMCLHAV